MALPDLTDAVVQLTAPDGSVYRFRYGATIPYAGESYVVLLEMTDDPAKEGQILVTSVVEEDGALSFVAAQEADVIEQVYNKYVLHTIRQAVADLPEDGGCCEHDCNCHHH